jgi:hypothetical protein
MSASLILIPIIVFGFIGLFGPVIAGAYLATRLNGRRR